MRPHLLAACCLTASVSVARGEPERASVLLERGRAVERAVGAGEIHRYHVQLAADEVMRAVVEQRGLDVVVSWFDPDGVKLGEVDSPTMDRGTEPVLIEARRAGAYVIEVRPFAAPDSLPAAPTAPGTYEARIEEIVSAGVHAERVAKASFDSPRMFALWKDLRDGVPDAEAKFWAEIAGKAPLVEPYPGDAKDVLVTFAFRALRGTRYVGLIGGPTAWESPMARLRESDVWTLTARLPADSRFAYGFIADDGPAPFLEPFRAWSGIPPRFAKIAQDPNNPITSLMFSATALPGAPAQPWTEPQPDVPAGTMTTLSIESTHLGEARRVGVYTPPGYDATRNYALVVAFDGEVYGLDPGAPIPLPRILDNLIAAKKIPPVVLALVASQATRDRDLPGSAPFSKFVALEVVPRLRADYRAGLTAAQTLLTGSSFGGLCSAFTAFSHPDVVGNVLSQSGSFGYHPGELETGSSLTTERGWLIREFVTAPRKPIRFYLEAGTFETDALHALRNTNRRLRDVLEAKGYSVTYAEFHGGHDYNCWRGTISDGLIALLGPPGRTTAAR